MIKVGFQGEPGAYSEIAAARVGEPVPMRTFEDVFKAIERGDVECGALPLENSLGGTIHDNYDLMLSYPVEILAETYVRIEHCLLGLPGSSLAAARQVLSHPQGLAQCAGFISANPRLEPVATYDTAGSAKMIKEGGDLTRLAIASERAARVYGLEVLERGIALRLDNYTRFALLGQRNADRARYGLPKEARKVSIAFALAHETGSLFHALSVFALRGINLTKIESRPLRDRPFEYLFYMDFNLPETPDAVERALSHLGEITRMLVRLGSYGTLGDTPLCY